MKMKTFTPPMHSVSDGKSRADCCYRSACFTKTLLRFGQEIDVDKCSKMKQRKDPFGRNIILSVTFCYRKKFLENAFRGEILKGALIFRYWWQ